MEMHVCEIWNATTSCRDCWENWSQSFLFLKITTRNGATSSLTTSSFLLFSFPPGSTGISRFFSFSIKIIRRVRNEFSRCGFHTLREYIISRATRGTVWFRGGTFPCSWLRAENRSGTSPRNDDATRRDATSVGVGRQVGSANVGD